MAAKDPTPARFPTIPPRSVRAGGGGDALTSAVIELAGVVGELKNAVNSLSNQGEAQTRELKEIRDQITGARAILRFIGIVVGFVGLATILKWWPVIHVWLEHLP
jgi:hypothetical protein